MSDTKLDDQEFERRPWDVAAWFAGVGFIGFVIWWAVGNGYSISMYVDYPSIGLVCGSAMCLTIMSFGWRRCVDAVGAFWHLDASDVVREEASAVFRMAAAFAIGTGFLGAMLGMIKRLANMSDPAQIGVGMAMSLLSQLYSILLGMLLAAASVAVNRKRSSRRQVVFASQSLAVVSAVIAVGTLTVCGATGIVLLSMRWVH